MVALKSVDRPTMECETEHFLMAQRQLDEIAFEMGLDRELHERLRYPKRALIVTVPVRMDDGTVRSLRDIACITTPRSAPPKVVCATTLKLTSGRFLAWPC